MYSFSKQIGGGGVCLNGQRDAGLTGEEEKITVDQFNMETSFIMFHHNTKGLTAGMEQVLDKSHAEICEALATEALFSPLVLCMCAQRKRVVIDGGTRGATTVRFRTVQQCKLQLTHFETCMSKVTSNLNVWRSFSQLCR